MDLRTQEILLEHVTKEWWSLPAGMRPWGMWITLHLPLPEDADTIDPSESRPCRAWFLDERGVRPHSVNSYRRFWVVQFEQPWCRRPYGEPAYTVGQRFHLIGWAAFASYIGKAEVYIETTFGPLFGRGYRAAVDGGEVRVVRELWRS
jgi:hypothetical protein